MTLISKRSVAAPTRRAAIAAALLLGTAVCASAMSLRIEVPAQAVTATATTQESANAPIRVRGRVLADNLVSKVNPIYPPEAKAQGIQGTVILHAIIGKDGTIQDLNVISGPEELQASAMDAVRQWVYKPYLLNGNPVEIDTQITVNYSLNH